MWAPTYKIEYWNPLYMWLMLHYYIHTQIKLSMRHMINIYWSLQM